MRSNRSSERVALIHRLLRGGGRVTLAHLADELGVTERTVCRDLLSMKEKLGLPVAHTSDRGYHYTRPVPLLATREAVFGPAPGLNPTARAGRLRRILETIHEALYGGNKIWIESYERPDSPAPFILCPLFLSKVLGDLLLFGYRSSDEILLNLSVRLLDEVRLTPQTFESALGEGPKVRESEGWAGKGARHEIRLRFSLEASWAEDLVFAERQILDRLPSGLSIRFRTDDLGKVRKLVLFLGEKVSAEAPPALLSLLGEGRP